MDRCLPTRNTDYGAVQYWNDRYESEHAYDWLQGFADLNFTELLTIFLKKNDRILILGNGCGNSQLSEDLYKEGYLHITNIDYSQVCIDKMAARCKHCPQMKWEVMDMYNLNYANETYDVVLEKATLDVLMVKETDPWNLSRECRENMDKVLTEVSRVLTPGGTFLSITFAQPHFRKPLYARSKFNWSVDYRTFGETFHYFLYIMQKGQNLSAEDLKKEQLQTRNETEEERTVIFLDEVDDDNFLLSIDL